MKKGFKIVRQRRPDGPLMSMLHDMRGAVVYEEGKQTVPIPFNGPLAVFSNEEDARYCIGRLRRRRHEYTDRSPFFLHECEYEAVGEAWRPHLDGYALWQVYPVGDETYTDGMSLKALYSENPGTVLASMVILGKRIEGEKWWGE